MRWIGTTTDIDDYKRLSDELEECVEERTRELRRSLAEKKTLLQEVHNRVKNNLQIVCRLLSTQIDSSGSDELNAPLNNVHSLVLAMSLIHEQIYQSATLADLSFGDEIERLADRLLARNASTVAHPAGAQLRADSSYAGSGDPDFRIEDSPSLRLQIVRTMVGQLRGYLVTSGQTGATFSFPWKL